MNWPSGMQWEWAIGEFAVLGFLFWELRRLRRSQRQDRERARGAAEAEPAVREGERGMAGGRIPSGDP
jgi:hypothetical protein